MISTQTDACIQDASRRAQQQAAADALRDAMASSAAATNGAQARAAAAAARQLVTNRAAPQHPPPPPVVVGLRDVVFGDESNWCCDGQNHSVIWRVPSACTNRLLVRILLLCM